jgi:hypothetical protein
LQKLKFLIEKNNVYLQSKEKQQKSEEVAMTSIRGSSEGFIEKVQAEASHFEGKAKYVKAVWNLTVGKQFDTVHIAHQENVAGQTVSVARATFSFSPAQTPPPERSESPIRAVTEGTAPSDPKVLDVSRNALLTEVNEQLTPIYQKLEKGENLTDQEMAIAFKAIDVRTNATKAKTREEISQLSKDLKNIDKSITSAYLTISHEGNRPPCISSKAWNEMFAILNTISIELRPNPDIIRKKSQALLKIFLTTSKLSEKDRNKEPLPGTEKPGNHQTLADVLQKKFEDMLPST